MILLRMVIIYEMTLSHREYFLTSYETSYLSIDDYSPNVANQTHLQRVYLFLNSELCLTVELANSYFVLRGLA
jgi:hypothetical protein